MQDQQIINATITIEEVVDKGKKLSIKAHDGQRVSTYNIQKDKSNGTPTLPHAQFLNMNLKAGSTVMIGYVIDEYDTEFNGIPKRVRSKKIINFREAGPQVNQVAPKVESPRSGANNASQGPLNDNYGRRLALHGFVNGMLAHGTTVETIIKDLPALLKLEDEIERVLVGGDLPVIQQAEDTDASDFEDVPF